MVNERNTNKSLRKETIVAAKELFGVDFFSETDGCEDLAMFGNDVLARIKEVPISLDEHSFRSKLTKIMDMANSLFPWNDTRLDLIPEVE